MSDTEERTLKPTARKLRKAREQGQIPLQRDMRLLLVTMGGLLFLWSSIDDFAAHFQHSATMAFSLLQDPTQSFDEIIAHSVGVGTRLVGTLFLVLVGVLFVSSVALNRGIVFSLAPITPKMSNIGFVSGLKRMFGLRALTDVGKALVRIVFALAGIWIAVRYWGGALLHAPGCGLGCVLDLTVLFVVILVGIVVAVSIVCAILDLPLQVWLFQRDQNMTKTEMKNESKDANGAPEIRNAMRRLRREAAESKTGRLGTARATLIVAGADEAVALRYVKAEQGIPIVVAKIRGAEKMDALIDQAADLGIPMMQDEQLARRILRSARPGKAIQQSEYGDTAKLISATL